MAKTTKTDEEIIAENRRNGFAFLCKECGREVPTKGLCYFCETYIDCQNCQEPVEKKDAVGLHYCSEDCKNEAEHSAKKQNLVFKSGGIKVWKTIDYLIEYFDSYNQKDVMKFIDFIMGLKKSKDNFTTHITGFDGDMVIEKMQENLIKAKTIKEAEKARLEILNLF